MAAALDMVHRRTARPDRTGLLSASPAPALAWIETLTGAKPGQTTLYTRALTHSSANGDNYERIEFLGDRVLGLVMAEWLYEAFPADKEGQLSRRLNSLVTGAVCADVAREIGLPAHITLGKQARDDGALDSDNVLGDVMEAVIGALYLDHGFGAARDLIRRLWANRLETAAAAPKHPKSELQEWAAANRRKAPEYALVSRTGPHHNLRFVVSVAIPGVGDAQAEGSSKQEAETQAAATLLARLS